MSEILSDESSVGPIGRHERRERSDKVAEKVARRILRDIVARQLQPGAKLPSEALMIQRYEVGRASLREGLRILEVYGLIWIKPGPGGGPIVSDVSFVDFGRSATLFYHANQATVRELVEARTYMEPLMARLAAERVTEETAESLRQSLAWESAALTNPVEPKLPPNSLIFHNIIAKMSGNRLLGFYGQSILAIYAERVRLVSSVDRSHIHEAHRGIYSAITQGKATRAERLMRDHVEEMEETFSDRYPGLASEIVDWR